MVVTPPESSGVDVGVGSVGPEVNVAKACPIGAAAVAGETASIQPKDGGSVSGLVGT